MFSTTVFNDADAHGSIREDDDREAYHKMRTFTTALTLVVLFCLPAMAQTNSRALATTAATVGTGAGVVTGAHSRTYLALFNQSASNTVYCTLDGSTPVASATANQLTFPPLSGLIWAGPVVPSNSISCIASGAGTPLTEVE